MLEGVAEPLRDGMGAIANVTMSPASGIENDTADAISASSRKRTVTIKHEAVLPVTDIEWNFRASQAARCLVQLVGDTDPNPTPSPTGQSGSTGAGQGVSGAVGGVVGVTNTATGAVGTATGGLSTNTLLPGLLHK